MASKSQAPQPKKSSEPQPGAEHYSPATTGVAYGMRAITQQGFNNFEIVTFFIINGEIVYEDVSQAYAKFEAFSRLEIKIQASVWNLDANYRSGALYKLGGEVRDDLIKKLKAEGKEDVLKKIEPAMRFA